MRPLAPGNMSATVLNCAIFELVSEWSLISHKFFTYRNYKSLFIREASHCLVEQIGTDEKVMGLNRPFYSEMKMLVRKRGCHEPHTVLLRRTKLMRREQVLSDPERFRAYLQETGFWQRAEGLTVVDGGIRVDRGVLRKEFSRLAIYLQLYCQSSSILRLY